MNEMHLIATADNLSRMILKTNLIKICSTELFKNNQISMCKLANDQENDEWCKSLVNDKTFKRKLKTINKISYLIWFKEN